MRLGWVLVIDKGGLYMDKKKKERRSFFSWLKNVYMYHYLWPTILVLLVLGFIGLFIRESLITVEPDFTMVVGSVDIWREADMANVIAVIKDEVGDANGDGEVNINVEIYTPTLNKGDETGQQNLQALDMAFMGDADKVFYIFDDELSLRYEPDYFEYLSDYGISSEKDPLYRVNELPVFKSMLVVDTPYYMCLKGWKLSEKSNPDYTRNYELAVRVMKSLIEAE